MPGNAPGPASQAVLADGRIVYVDPAADSGFATLPPSSPGARMLASSRAALASPRRPVSAAPLIQLPPPPGTAGRIIKLPGGRLAVTPANLPPAAGGPSAAPVPVVDPPPGQPIIQAMTDGSLAVAPLPAAFAGDDAASINAAALQAGGPQGTGGLVRLGPYVYNIQSTIVLPAQSTGQTGSTNAGYNRGQGPVSLQGIYGATILNVTASTGLYCHRTDWWNPQQNSQPTPMMLGSSIRDITVDGTNAPAGAIGMDVGDAWGLNITGVLIRNFYSAAGTSIGFYQCNRIEWSEKCRFEVHTINCDNHVTVDDQAAAAGGNSHEYNDWRLYMYCLGPDHTLSGVGQNGMTWLNGSFMGGGSLFIRGNHGGNGVGNPGYMLKIGGGPNDAANGYSSLFNVLYSIVCECNGSTNGPSLIVLNGPNNSMKGHGVISAQFGGWGNSQLNGGLFGVSGRVDNDPGLVSPTTPAVPASGAQLTWNGIDVMVYLTGMTGGGGVTDVKINGFDTGLNPGAGPAYLGTLTANSTIRLTYNTSTPTWTFVPVCS